MLTFLLAKACWALESDVQFNVIKYKSWSYDNLQLDGYAYRYRTIALYLRPAVTSPPCPYDSYSFALQMRNRVENKHTKVDSILFGLMLPSVRSNLSHVPISGSGCADQANHPFLEKEYWPWRHRPCMNRGALGGHRDDGQ